MTGVGRRSRFPRLGLVRGDRNHADVQRLAGAAGLAAEHERREREVRASRGGVVGRPAGGALKCRHRNPRLPAPSRAKHSCLMMGHSRIECPVGRVAPRALSREKSEAAVRLFPRGARMTHGPSSGRLLLPFLRQVADSGVEDAHGAPLGALLAIEQPCRIGRQSTRTPTSPPIRSVRRLTRSCVPNCRRARRCPCAPMWPCVRRLWLLRPTWTRPTGPSIGAWHLAGRIPLFIRANPICRCLVDASASG